MRDNDRSNMRLVRSAATRERALSSLSSGVAPDNSRARWLLDRLWSAVALVLVTVCAYQVGHFRGAEQVESYATRAQLIARNALEATNSCTILLREQLAALHGAGAFRGAERWLQQQGSMP